jgi:hypothetical protein
LVHSYARVGLYLYSTVTYSWLAQIFKKLKILIQLSYNKIIYCRFLWKIFTQNKDRSSSTSLLFFLIKPNLLETMGVIHHGHCRHPWPSGATSATISWPATSWTTMAALNFIDFKQGGELLIKFQIGENLLIFATTVALTNRASAAARGPLAPIPPKSVGATQHGQCQVLLVLFKTSKGGEFYHIFFTACKNKVNVTICVLTCIVVPYLRPMLIRHFWPSKYL